MEKLRAAAFLTVVVFAIYGKSLNGEFIFDDDLMLTGNRLIKSPDGIARFWFTTDQPDYTPLTSSVLWVEWHLWGTTTTGYRIVNLILHIGAALMVWRILVRLSIPGGYLAALIYAIHPVCVESVAWIDQLKDTLSTPLFLASIFCFLRNAQWHTTTKHFAQQDAYGRPDPPSQAHDRGPASIWPSRWYWLSLVAFVLSICSKGSVAILPLVLVLIVWWEHVSLRAATCSGLRHSLRSRR